LQLKKNISSIDNGVLLKVELIQKNYDHFHFTFMGYPVRTTTGDAPLYRTFQNARIFVHISPTTISSYRVSPGALLRWAGWWYAALTGSIVQGATKWTEKWIF